MEVELTVFIVVNFFLSYGNGP